VQPGDSRVVYAASEIPTHNTGRGFGVHFNRGLRTRAVVDLAISTDGLVLYATTTGEGVFHLERTAR